MFEWDKVLPVITLVIGFFLKLVSDLFTHSRTEKRDIRARRDEFQRATLLATQEAALKLCRHTIAVGIHHCQMGIDGHSYGTTELPSQLDEDVRVCMAELKLLDVRIRASSVRGPLDLLREQAFNAVTAKSIEQSELAENNIITHFESLNDEIRKALRELGL